MRTQYFKTLSEFAVREIAVGRLQAVTLCLTMSKLWERHSASWGWCQGLIDKSSLPGLRGPEQGSNNIHQRRIWTNRGKYFDCRTMPNTMPGFCIEALRPVATPQLDFTTKPFSGRNM